MSFSTQSSYVKLLFIRHLLSFSFFGIILFANVSSTTNLFFFEFINIVEYSLQTAVLCNK